jgi:hypothetical protein
MQLSQWFEMGAMLLAAAGPDIWRYGFDVALQPATLISFCPLGWQMDAAGFAAHV